MYVDPPIPDELEPWDTSHNPFDLKSLLPTFAIGVCKHESDSDVLGCNDFG
jgi:hypothetical protein